MTDKPRTQIFPIEVECPRCEAPKGALCVTDSGGKTAPHAMRREYAKYRTQDMLDNRRVVAVIQAIKDGVDLCGAPFGGSGNTRCGYPSGHGLIPGPDNDGFKYGHSVPGTRYYWTNSAEQDAAWSADSYDAQGEEHIATNNQQVPDEEYPRDGLDQARIDVAEYTGAPLVHQGCGLPDSQCTCWPNEPPADLVEIQMAEEEAEARVNCLGHGGVMTAPFDHPTRMPPVLVYPQLAERFGGGGITWSEGWPPPRVGDIIVEPDSTNWIVKAVIWAPNHPTEPALYVTVSRRH
jgi:hypothetical protein